MTRSQLTLAGTGFEKSTKVTRREQFFAEMNRVMPWGELCARIDRSTPSRVTAGRPSAWSGCCGSILQHWFNLSDPAVEGALYDSPTMRAFVGIDLRRAPVPDEITVCKFRLLLEAHGLAQAVFDAVTQHLRGHG